MRFVEYLKYIKNIDRELIRYLQYSNQILDILQNIVVYSTPNKINEKKIKIKKIHHQWNYRKL